MRQRDETIVLGWRHGIGALASNLARCCVIPNITRVLLAVGCWLPGTWTQRGEEHVYVCVDGGGRNAVVIMGKAGYQCRVGEVCCNAPKEGINTVVGFTVHEIGV